MQGGVAGNSWGMPHTCVTVSACKLILLRVAAVRALQESVNAAMRRSKAQTFTIYSEWVLNHCAMNRLFFYSYAIEFKKTTTMPFSAVSPRNQAVPPQQKIKPMMEKY
jgi:hypothetical protein